MSRSIGVLGLLLLLVTTSAMAAMDAPVAKRGTIVEYRLDNGLSVVLAPDPSANALFFNLVYLAGSLADPQGKGGTAHLLEHLMFKGTQQRSGEALVQGLAQRGIQFNATTSYDRTRYTAVLDTDPDKLDYLLALEAERMHQLRFQQQDLTAELEVVLREMELAQDQPVAALGQAMLSAASPGQGLGRPVLGTREELGNIRLQDLQAFYQRHYRPDQAVIVLTGRFDPESTLIQIRRHFAAIKPPTGQTPTAQPNLAPLDKAVNVHVAAGDTDWVAVAYPLPAADDPVNVPLAVLADIMAGQPHGRLYQSLVETSQAQGVLALQLGFRRAGYYLFAAPLLPDQSAAAVLTQLAGQLESLTDNPLTAAELERFQATVAAQQWQLLQNPALLAEILSESAATGDWQLLLRRFDQYAGLTLAEVQQQAVNLLQPERRLAGQLQATAEPTAVKAPDVASAGRSDTATASMAQTTAVALTDFDLAAFNQQLETVEASIQRFTLDNGLKVALRPMPGTGKAVQGRMTLRFGNEESLQGKRALADLTGTLILRGTRNASYQQIVDQVNRLGAGLIVQPSGGGINVRLETPPQHLESLLTLLAEVLQQPALPQRDFDLIKRQQLQALRQSSEQPASVANLQYLRQVERYPVGHLLRHREQDELRAELEGISLDEVKAFYQQFYGSNHGELTLSGDFDAARLTKQLQTLFGDWNSAQAFSRTHQQHQPMPAARLHVKANAARTGHYLAYLHFPANNAGEDTAALMIAEHLLGRNPLASRLSIRLRQEEGLTYDVRSSIKVANFGTDSWVNIRADYPRGQGERLANIVREEVTRLVEQGITPQELALAKQTILQERRQVFSQDESILAQLPTQLYRNTTFQSWIEHNDAFAAVTVEQVQAAIHKYLAEAIWVEVLADRDGKP